MPEPPPLDRSHPLHSRDLRQAALAVLVRAGVSSISEILEALSAAGFTVAGASPNKVLADALGHEVRLGRVRRGHYAIARLPATTAWRVRQRWRGPPLSAGAQLTLSVDPDATVPVLRPSSVTA
jgi:hypothetical protein